WMGSVGDTEEAHNWRFPAFKQGDDHPVVCVSWNDAAAFCKWLSKRTGRKVRLPTEAEWEYVCRAGTETPYSTGVAITTDQANFDGTPGEGDEQGSGIFRKGTTHVGEFPPNPWHVYDMHGNVAEWCADGHARYFDAFAAVDPTGPAKAPHRVLRDGAWYYRGKAIQSHERNGAPPTYRNWGLGFRVVVETK
ncbi:MAG: SUMF1/EgtB/PvdO family nonheme iron enzyme, partial [Phycisphaerae bacterium]|nr:SUMF1/EgtB/PvdO family nonheme iron enzyme [Phycisphaerae bacterium]